MQPASPSPDTKKRLIKQWLVRFALNAGQALDSDAQAVYLSLWMEAFADLSVEILEAAFKKTLATAKFWPIKVADVREHIEKAKDSRLEEEWQGVLEYCRKFVNADLGLARAPKLPADILHAANAAGGLYFLESCPTEDLVWAKKRFCEDLARQRKTGDLTALLPSSELAGLLSAAASRFSLPTASSESPMRIKSQTAKTPYEEADPPSRDEVRRVLSEEGAA